MKINELRVGDIYYAMRYTDLGYAVRVNIEGDLFSIEWLEKPQPAASYGYENSGDYVFRLSDGTNTRTFKQVMEHDSYDDSTRGDLYEVMAFPVEKVEYRRKS